MLAGNERVPLATAARRLRKSRDQAYRLVLIGKLDGEKEGNSWMVTEASIRSLELHSGAVTSTAA